MLSLTFAINKKFKLPFLVISSVTAHVCVREVGGRWAGLVKHPLSGWNVEARPDCADPGASVGGAASSSVATVTVTAGCLDPGAKREAAKNVVKYQDGDPSQGAAPHLSLHTIH